MTENVNVAEDVFTESPPIVDIEVLEAAKENIQPLASGRRVTTLSAILTTPHAQRDAQLNAARQRYRLNVEIALQDEDDDPLEAYVRFVNWTVENYPQGQSAESGLLELLEEATRVLKDNRGGIWKEELKYLKLWVLYASFVEKQTMIFRFLLANDIGTSHALLYEEYAAILERQARKSDADSVFLLGIARQAHPLEHLQSKHAEFQKRMMSSIAMPPPPVPESSSRRAALGMTASSSSSGSLGRAHAPSSSQSDVFGSNPSVSRAVPNSRLQIFVDPSGAEPQEELMLSYPDIGTRKSRVKENIPEVKKAAGTTLKSAGRSRRVASGSSTTSTSTGSTSRIVPYRDPGPEEIAEADSIPPPSATTAKLPAKTPARNSTMVAFQDPDCRLEGGVPSTPRFTPFRDEVSPDTPSTSTVVSAPETVMKPKGAGKGLSVLSEAEALRKDPLKNYSADECKLVDD
ncbi:Mad3/BUB1 homology region 1-domain-containing protein [Melanogaster broomeanus]|nr:Mad3/BUB1 homology region 1-domain-containing protein [Melanogaster broomeanus]